MSRWRADTMPAVTVPPSPNGLPIAITQSPTREPSESPKPSGLSVFSPGSTRSSAMSVLASRPITFASSRVLSDRMTAILSASAMTWLLVTITPDASMTKPEPSEVIPCRGMGLCC